MGISKTAVIEVIARKVARAEGIEIPEELEDGERWYLEGEKGFSICNQR